MSRIAHLSDLHVLGGSTSTLWNRLVRRRARKVLHAIAAAKERGATQVFTGDVTDSSRWGRPIVVALHHPPLPHAWRAWQSVDHARDARRVRLYDPCSASAALACTSIDPRSAA